jgi:hypothetical protein
MWFKVESMEPEQIKSKKGNKVDGYRVFGESVSNKFGNQEKDYWIPGFKEDWVNVLDAACPGKKVQMDFELNADSGYQDLVDIKPLDVDPANSTSTGNAEATSGGTGGITEEAIAAAMAHAGDGTQTNEQVAMSAATNLVGSMLMAQERLKQLFKANTKTDMVLDTTMTIYEEILQKLKENENETFGEDTDDSDLGDDPDDDDIPF